MKLFARDDVREGQIYREDAVVVFGRLIELNGWYILFNLKFIQKDVDNYIDRETWEKRAARCYYRTRFKLRRIAINRRWIFNRDSAWDEVQSA